MDYYQEFPLRSLDQHNYEWLVYRMISDITGHTIYEIYQICAMRFLKVIDASGNLCFVKPSSLNTLHHKYYMIQIQAFYAKFGIIIPDPDKSKKSKIKFSNVAK